MTEPLQTDSEIIGIARDVISTREFEMIRSAHAEARALETSAAGFVIVYQPDLPEGICGVTLFGEAGFVIGPGPFQDEEELQKTVLHELFRLLTRQEASGADIDEIAAQTSDAYDFARRAWPILRASYVRRARRT